MPRAEQVLALVKSHLEGDAERFKTVALQVAAHEARSGHESVAREMRDLLQRFEERNSILQPGVTTIHIAQPRGELANLVSATFPRTSFAALELPHATKERLQRVLKEQLHISLLTEHGLQPRRKFLLVGAPGTGKTMTASAIAGELNLPLLTILLEGVITRYMGESAAKLKLVFDAMTKTRAVFLFDEFDAIGAKRTATNDVGEIRRILNSFLQLLENDRSESIIVCATNHPELLDRALFRRFDDVIRYQLPDGAAIEHLFRTRLGAFDLRNVNWESIIHDAKGLSQADIVRVAEEAAKSAVLAQVRSIDTEALAAAVTERKGPIEQ